MNLYEYLEQGDYFETDSVRQRLEAWDKIADHPIFRPAYDSQKTLITAMLEILDRLSDD